MVKYAAWSNTLCGQGAMRVGDFDGSGVRSFPEQFCRGVDRADWCWRAER